MFTVRRSQLEAFEAASRRRFEDGAIQHLSRSFPEAFARVGEAAARELVACGIEKAAAYGIRRVVDVTAFISLLLVLGPDFEQAPENAWMRELLESTLLDPDAKVAKVYEGLSTPPAEGPDGEVA